MMPVTMPKNNSVTGVGRYVNWTKRHECLSLNTWQRLPAFVTALRTVKCINFSSLETHSEACNTLNKIPIEVNLFSRDKRFPEGLYICENFGIWSGYLQQLRKSLEHDSKNVLKMSQSRQECQVREDYADFSNCIAKINHAIFTADGIWDREDFESYFQLKWEE